MNDKKEVDGEHWPLLIYKDWILVFSISDFSIMDQYFMSY